VIEKEPLKFKELEHVLIEKIDQLFWNMLERRGSKSLNAIMPSEP
jgi:hypothetical protein